MKPSLFLFLLLTLFISCDSNSYEDIDTSKILLDLKINRLDQEQINLTNLSKSTTFLDNHPIFMDLMLNRSLPSKEILAKVLVDMANDKTNQKLLIACQKDYPDFAQTEKEFINAFKHIKYYYPDFAINQISTFSGGLTSGYDMTIHKNNLFIGIDHFLKDKETFRPNPQVFHNYMLNFYNRQNLVIKASLLLSQKYNAYDKKEQTLLSSMIFYGKSYYFVKTMNPEVANSLIIEYSDEEWKMAEKHIAMIWKHFVKKELFYSTDKQLQSKYVDPRPKTTEVADVCPGRIGQWLGFKIVEAYMKNNPSVTLQELMQETNTQKIFQQSQFRPTK